ncbi:MAG: endonuclease/exonuclease/phosphatase family protein [Ignavibacteria bacterium]|jgi:endonuclease/exonuclease/phosphatase family metal-dependent hydrolase
MDKVYYVTVIFLFQFAVFAQDINFMTYNIRYDNPQDGENSWPHRKEFLLSQIKYNEPDILGIQEGLIHQVKWLDENLEQFNFVGRGRDESEDNKGGEFSAIFYHKEKYEVLESSTFWLSETPDIPSKGWDAALNRICTYALLKIKENGKKFWVFNAHFDHKGIEARKKSAELILKQIDSKNSEDYPLLLMGDFNLGPTETPIAIISKALNDSRKVSESEPFGPEQTFAGFDVCAPPSERIDYIFTNKKITVKKYAALCDVKDMKYPSDHFPVIIKASFTTN